MRPRPPPPNQPPSVPNGVEECFWSENFWGFRAEETCLRILWCGGSYDYLLTYYPTGRYIFFAAGKAEIKPGATRKTVHGWQGKSGRFYLDHSGEPVLDPLELRRLGMDGYAAFETMWARLRELFGLNR